MVAEISSRINVNQKLCYAGRTNVVGQKVDLTRPKMQLPNNSHYFIAFLGRKDWTKNEREFFEFKKVLARKEHEAEVQANIAGWNFDTNMSDDNLKKVSAASEKLAEIESSPETLKRLLKFKKKGVKDTALKQELKQLIEFYKTNIKTTKQEEQINQKEKEFIQKLNKYMSKHGNLKKSAHETYREYYIRTKKVPGELMASGLIELVKMRNKLANAHGFDNYFSYMLSEIHEVNEKELLLLLEKLEKQTRKDAKKIVLKNNRKLSDYFHIQNGDFQPYHYCLFLIETPENKIKNHLKTETKIKKMAQRIYKQMGWDIDKLPIKMDLSKRKNKNQYPAMCYQVEAGKDSRILATLQADLNSFTNLLHELGHANYNLGLPMTLKLSERKVCNDSCDEAIAVLMESLPYNEDILIKKFSVPKELAKEIKEYKRVELIKFIRKYLVFINFERELYKNPDQNLDELWAKLFTKFEFRNPPKTLDKSWAAMEHYIEDPAYLQSYVRAEIIASQIYESAVEKLGPLTHNKGTAEFFRKNFFRFGSTLTEKELIKRITGKPLSTDAFVRRLQGAL